MDKVKKLNLSTKNLLEDVSRWTKMFLFEKKTLGRAENTILQYTKVLEDFYEYAAEIQDMFNIEDLNKQHILGYLMYKEKSTENFSASSKQTHITILKAFFRYITENNDENKDLLKSIKTLKISTPKKEPEGLTKEELTKIFKSFEVKINKETKFTQTIIIRNRLLFKVLVLGGLRASEILSLKLSDFVKIEEDFIYKIKVVGKGNKERFIFIDSGMIEKELECLSELKYKYIAETNKKTQIDRKNLYNVINNILEANNINKKGVHLLRHTFARNLVSKNISISTIKTLMGHSNLETTMIYAKTNEENMINAAKTLIVKKES